MANAAERPAATAALNLTWPGSDQAGTIFFTRRTTKFTIGPLGKPSRSPIAATTTVRKGWLAMAFCSVVAKFSSTMAATAPESLS